MHKGLLKMFWAHEVQKPFPEALERCMPGGHKTRRLLLIEATAREQAGQSESVEWVLPGP